jgi:hypothetical protein
MDDQEQQRVDDKITADLDIVIEKMDLLHQMIKPGADSPTPSVKNHEALLAVIGFLEACAPRMVELVEAAAQGLLSGHVLEKCLAVNDRLLKQLQEIDTLALTETAASTTAASAPVKDMADLLLDEHDHDHDFDFDNGTSKKQPASVAGTKSTGEEDDEDVGKMPAVESKPTAVSLEADDVGASDSFDDFFAERTAAFTKQGDQE